MFGDDGSVNEFPDLPGVYAVYDKAGALQYVGLSRKMGVSISGHAKEVPELTAEVKLHTVPDGDKDSLQTKWKEWMQEHVVTAGAIPPGNAKGSTLFAKGRLTVRPDVRLTPGGNKELSVDINELIGMLVKDFPVLLFMKGTRNEPQCGFSYNTVQLLNESRADYDVVNVLDEEHNPGLREAIKEFSQWPTIPQLYIGGEFVGGADIVQEMGLSGELQTMLDAAPKRK